VTSLTVVLATGFARAALANVTREYPRHLLHLLTGPADRRSQRELHPSFYGRYDWHSAVHMHWLLARLLRTHPLPDRSRTRSIASRAAALADKAYFESPRDAPSAPYGWAWLLELQAELLRSEPALERGDCPAYRTPGAAILCSVGRALSDPRRRAR
jgi:hypothetical protein